MGRRLNFDIDATDELGILLDKDKGDHIIWSADDRDFTIIFNHEEGSPFTHDRFWIYKEHPGADSGAPINGVKGRSYSYSIYDGILPHGQDPKPTGSPKVRIKP